MERECAGYKKYIGEKPSAAAVSKEEEKEEGNWEERSLKRFIAFVMDAGNFQGLNVERKLLSHCVIIKPLKMS